MSNQSTTETKIDERTQCLINIAVFDELLNNPAFRKKFKEEYKSTKPRSAIRKLRAEAVERFLQLDDTFQALKKHVVERVVKNCH